MKKTARKRRRKRKAGNDEEYEEGSVEVRG
jgi:hypothetical protein